jgi:preprotein translocase subunit SecY
MFRTIINAWKVKDIRTRLLFTLLLVVVYRFGCFIPVPGVDAAAISGMIDKYDMLGFLNLLSGGSFADFTIFAMGISPYITGQIIIQLLAVAIPALERMQKEEDGKIKLEKITRYVGIGLALVQSVGIVLGLGSNVVKDTSFLTYATIGLTCTAGTALLVWMGERITEKGVGNGVSMIIFLSICSRVIPVIVSFVEGVFVTGIYQWWILIALLVFVIILVAGVVFVDKAVRRVPVQYAKKVVGRKLYGGQSSHIPLKVNANGVMPLIFAMTIIQFPAMIVQFLKQDSGFTVFYKTYLASGTPIYFVVYALMILGFAYFYSTIAFNPIEISKNLQQNGGFIPGIRPGRPTSDYLAKKVSRLTLFGAIFLMILAIVPEVIMQGFGLRMMFGPTSILILVNVALETSSQLESMMLMRHYKGFLG